jgi:hypothetical protein
MATPSNATCTIGGKSFDAVEIKMVLLTPPDRSGMPTMGSLQSRVRVIVDISDTTNMPFGTLNQLFTWANVATNANVQDIKLEYWQDDSKQNALCSVKFKGWISGFQTVNPVAAPGQTDVINDVLVLDLQPQLNQSNQPSYTLSN